MGDICFVMMAAGGFVVALGLLYLLAVYVVPFIFFLPVRAFEWVRDEIRWRKCMSEKIIGYKLKGDDHWLR